MAEKFYESIPYERQVELAKLAQAGDTNARNELVRAMSRLAVQVAAKFKCDRSKFPLDDRIQVALMAVMRAAGLWDPAKGRLTTYAAKVVWSQLMRYVQSNGFIRIPADFTKEQRDAVPRVSFLSLKTHKNDSRSGRAEPLIWAIDKSPNHAEELAELGQRLRDNEVLRNTFVNAIEGMREQVQEVLILRLVDQMSFKAIGRNLGVSKQRAYRIYQNGVQKLRKNLGLRMLAQRQAA